MTDEEKKAWEELIVELTKWWPIEELTEPPHELDQRGRAILAADAELKRLRAILSRVEDVEGWLAKESMSVRFDTPVRRLRDISRAVRDYALGEG